MNQTCFANIPIMQLDVKESQDKMAGKILTLIKTTFQAYEKEFKWFLLADDDTFIFVDNLYKFISKISYKDPLTYGYNFKVIIPV